MHSAGYKGAMLGMPSENFQLAELAGGYGSSVLKSFLVLTYRLSLALFPIFNP